jgi:reverse gyrase
MHNASKTGLDTPHAMKYALFPYHPKFVLLIASSLPFDIDVIYKR